MSGRGARERTLVLRMAVLLYLGIVTTIVAAAAVAAWRLERHRRVNLLEREAELQGDLQAILTSLSSGLLMVDPTGRIKTVSRAACRILFCERQDVLGQELAIAFDEGWDEFSMCILQALAREDSVERREITLHRPDGISVPVGITVNPLYGARGVLTGAVAIFQDLTEVTRMRERVRKADRLAAVGELSASIAHEIRNPLGSIRGSAEMLAGELNLAGTEKRLMDLILRESDRVNTLISDFLGYARLRDCEAKLVLVNELLDDIALQMSMHEGVAKDQVCIMVHCDPSDLVLMIDEEQIRQVLLNLCLNAVQMSDGPVRIWLEATLDNDLSNCQILVRDNGPGIPDQILGDLFQPFVTTRKGGTGLGLATAQRIIHAHEGSIEGHNRHEGGAEFVLTIPLITSSQLPGELDSIREASASCVLN
jgi:PAS domain S-box-containing protein